MSILDPHPILIGPITTHGALFAVGALLATLVLARLRKPEGESFGDVVDRAFLIFALGLLGARLGFLVLYSEQWDYGRQLITIWEGGLLSYTGIAAGALTARFVTRTMSVSARLRFFDHLGIAVFVGWAVGRIGNYYAYESYGIVSSFWNAFYGRVPIQLFESLACLVIATLAYRLHTRLQPGFSAWITGISYLAVRVVLDLFREDPALTKGTPAVGAMVLLVSVFIAYSLWVKGRISRTS